MSIQSYNYAGCPIVAPLSITSNQPVFVNEAINLSQVRVSQEAQRWELTFSIVTNDAEADFLVDTVSTFDSVGQFEFPQLNSVNKRVTATLTPTLTSSVSAGATSVPVSDPGGLIPKGSFVKFSNHDKVYLVTSDLLAAGTLQIFPTLRANLPGSSLTVDSTDVTADSGVITADSSILPDAVPPIFVNHPGVQGVTLTHYQSETRLPGVVYEDGILASVNGVTLVEAL
jgi:hypothetical protein